MKRFVLIFLVILFAASVLPAESVMTGLFEAADEVSSDLPGIIRTQGDLLIGGVTYNQLQVKLGDLLADLSANRLAGRSGFRPQVVKHYSAIQYPPSQALWTLSGSLYEAGAGYLLILQVTDNTSGVQLKGWEFALGRDGIDDLLQPSVLALSAGVWDRFEPNDVSTEAVSIELPFYEEGLTLGDGDEDWFVIEAPATSGNSVLILEASTGGMMDTYMELYSPDDQSWAIAEDDDTDGANAVIQYPLSQSGTWYLKVRSYSVEEEGNYNLSITLREDVLGPGEPDEGQDLASLLNVGASPLQKQIDYGNDVDWFRLELLRPLGHDEVLRIETLSNLDLLMDLTDEYGGYIMDDDDSGQNNNPMIMASGLDSGTYFLTVSGYSGETGPYEIMANIMIPVKDEYEDDYSMIHASTITADSRSQRRTFSPMGDVDWIKFDIQTEGTYRIQTAGEIDTYMELYNEQGSLIEENDDGDDYNAIIERFLSPGSYFIMVAPYGTASPDDSYEISVKPLG